MKIAELLYAEHPAPTSLAIVSINHRIPSDASLFGMVRDADIRWEHKQLQRVVA